MLKPPYRVHIPRHLWLQLRTANLILALLLAVSASGWCGDAPVSPEVPMVVDATVPRYPYLALLAHGEGTVKIRVTTDGEHVSNVDILEGMPLLADAAKANIKTWKFKWYIRTSFETTFRYELLPGDVCSEENPIVSLQLPVRVEVRSHGLHTCDGSSSTNAK
jgi:hypothetical protein